MRGRFRGILGLFFHLILAMIALSVEAQKLSVLVNCGTNSTVNVEGRRWIGDTASAKNVTLSSPPGIEVSTSSINGDQIYEQLYRTARVFTQSLNYTFQLPNGNYFLRLHFYPFPFDGYNVNDSYFSVEANTLKLVSEFNVPGEIADKNLNLQGSGANSTYSHLLKEYFLSVESNTVVVSFTPSKESFGFVNGVELVQEGSNVFDGLVSRVGSNGARVSSLNLAKRGMETMYRLNVGGWFIRPSQDSLLWRTWEMDSGYMINADAGSELKNSSSIAYANPNNTSVAPLAVYETARTLTNAGVMEKRFNMSWKLEVHPDFEYFVRLHFCELSFDSPNQRVFRIFVDNKTAVDNFDVYTKAGGMNKAYHEDYVDSISSKSDTIWIQLGPDPTTGSAGTDALLNGLEVFKLSRDGNLAYVETYSNVKESKASRSLLLWVGIGAGVASIAVFAFVTMLVFWLCRRKRNENDAKKTPPGWRPLFLHGFSTANAKGSVNYQNPNAQNGTVRSGRRFSLAEIRAATNDFDESLVIGVGGFGKVYKGEIDDSTLAAIKRSNPQSQQGLNEFETEIEMLSKLRHRHLVSLIGFCDEQNEMILVYEYMSNGTFRSHLFGSDLPPLSWKQRLEICIGAARGLHYLHTGSDRGIIHRDVKTTNILLDEDFIAKMADFGLSKTGPSLEHTHVSTAVKGSFGYLDPEYFRRQHLTEKSDVYSFGVVLFEAVCARAVINPTLPRDQINLAEWAMRWQRERQLEKILDPRLKGKYCQESLMKFGEIAEKCLADEGKMRPTMGEVLWHLEYVLQLQEAWLRSNGGDDELFSEVVVVECSNSGDAELQSKIDESRDVMDPMAVGNDEFSQMINQQGR